MESLVTNLPGASSSAQVRWKSKIQSPRRNLQKQSDVFEDMERSGCQNIEEEDKTEKWFACFEAYQRDFDNRVDDVEMLQEGTTWNKMHVPVSFSVGCNLEGVETEHR